MRAIPASLAVLALSVLLRSQPVPPPQGYVADIGGSPLRSPATGDFAPGETFTMEGWFYPTAPAPFGWLLGKPAAVANTPVNISFGLFLQDC